MKINKLNESKLSFNLFNPYEKLNRIIKEDTSYEWKPNTNFKHIKDIYNKVKSNNYKFVNNEREEFQAAVKKAEKKGYKPEQCREIKKWSEDVWRHNRKTESKIIKENTELDRKYFKSLEKDEYGNYLILLDGTFEKQIVADNDEDAIRKFRDYLKESVETFGDGKNNDVKEKSIIRITGVKCDVNWIYDTMTDGIQISASVNKVPCKFTFFPCYGRYAVDGIDCNQISFGDDRYSKDLTHSGGGNRTYALYIPSSILKSKPKENQKDFRFTGQYYSTTPVVKYFKEILTELLSKHPEYFYPEILDRLGIASNKVAMNESINIDTIADYITDHYEFDDIDDKYACINSIRDSFNAMGEKTISQEVLDQFIGEHNGRDLVESSSPKREAFDVEDDSTEYIFDGTEIPESERHKIQKIIISDSLNYIPNNAFKNCTALTSIVIPDSVEWIGYHAFENCKSLTSITFPNSLDHLGNYMFRGCTSLTSVTIPKSIRKISTGAFSKSSIKNITIPSNIIEIESDAFLDCPSLENVIIEDGVKQIHDLVFAYCPSLKSITIPDSVTSIGYAAFYECTSLTNITLPKKLKNIKEATFDSCTSLNNVIIPSGLKRIYYAAFRNCTSLTNIVIPDSVNRIANHEEQDYDPHLDRYLKSTINDEENNPFYKCNSLTIICPKDSYASKYAKTYNIPVKLVESYSFKNKKNINEASLIDKKMRTLGKAGKPIYLTSKQLKDIKSKYSDYDFDEIDIGKSLPAGQKAYIAKKKLSESTVTRYQVEYYTDPDSEKLIDYIYADSKREAEKKFKDKVGNCTITAMIPEEVPSSYRDNDLKEASYGGAFDIEDDQYFTRDDLTEFAEDVVERLNTTSYSKFDYTEVYMEPGNILELTLVWSDYEETLQKRIDMRKIRKPQDLIRIYSPIFIMKAKSTFSEYGADFGPHLRDQDYPMTEDLSGKYSDKFKALVKKLGEDDNTLTPILSDMIRYCKEEDLKDLWIEKDYDNLINEDYLKEDSNIGSMKCISDELDITNFTNNEKILLTDNSAYDLEKQGISGVYVWIGYQHNRMGSPSSKLANEAKKTAYNIFDYLKETYETVKINDFIDIFDMYRVWATNEEPLKEDLKEDLNDDTIAVKRYLEVEIVDIIPELLKHLPNMYDSDVKILRTKCGEFYRLIEQLCQYYSRHTIEESFEGPVLRGPEEGPEAGLSTLLNSAIQSEFKAIQEYNDLAIMARSNGYDEIASAADEIGTDENDHVGKLQDLLKTVSPNAEAIDRGLSESLNLDKEGRMLKRLISQLVIDDDSELRNFISRITQEVIDKGNGRRIENPMNLDKDGKKIKKLISKIVVDNDDELKDYVMSIVNEVITESKSLQESGIQGNSMQDWAEHYYDIDRLEDFVCDQLKDGTLTEDDLINIAKKSSTIEVDDMKKAINLCK